MSTIVLVMSLKLANIGLPSKIIIVDERDGQIIFIGRNMCQMSVNSLRLTHVLAVEVADLLPLSLLVL